MVRDILSVMILALVVSLPLSMYKFTYDQRIIKTTDQLSKMMQNNIEEGIDIWGSDIIVEKFGIYVSYTSIGPDKKRYTEDDIRIFK